MGRNNEFNLLSLNVRGIRTFEKRKAVFSWLVNSDVDIIFLQETYSTRDIENIWRKQWKGEMFFSHGSNHSRGVLVLIKNNLDFKIHSTKVDSQGRGDVAADPKISHQWFETLTPNNTKTMGRMTCHCFQPPIRRDLRISCYTGHLSGGLYSGFTFLYFKHLRSK